MSADVSVETDVDMRRVVKKLFPYIWCKHRIISFLPPVVTTSPNRITNIAEIMAKSAFVYSCAHKPVIGEYLENSIKGQITTRVKFFRYATFLCLKIRLPEDNIFDYILTICATVADMALHCRENGFQRALYHSSTFFTAFFESELSNSFHTCGGWTCLLEYISECCFVDLYKRIEPFIAKGYGVVPAIITMKYECIASARRELMMNSRFPTECELESHLPTKLMVDKLLLWDLKEQMQVSDIVPGVFKRMPNIRRVKKSSDSETLISNKKIEDHTATKTRQYHSSYLNHCPFQREKGIRRKKTKIVNSPLKHPVTPIWNKSELLVGKSSTDLQQNDSETSDDSFYSNNIRYSLSPSKYQISEFSNLLTKPKMNHPSFHKLHNVCSQPEGNVKCQQNTSSTPKVNSRSCAENYDNYFVLPNSQNLSIFNEKKSEFTVKFSKKSISSEVNHLTRNNRQCQNLKTELEDSQLPGSFSLNKSNLIKMSNSSAIKSSSEFNSGDSNGTNPEENFHKSCQSLLFVDKSDSNLSSSFQILSEVLSKGIKKESTNLTEHSDKRVYAKSCCFCNRNHNFNTTELELAIIEHFGRVKYHKLKFQNYKKRCKIESLPPIPEADSEEEKTHSNTGIDDVGCELYNPVVCYANGNNIWQTERQDEINGFNQLHQQHIKEEAKIYMLTKSLERMGFTKPTIFKF